jgi:hypothetical protein
LGSSVRLDATLAASAFCAEPSPRSSDRARALLWFRDGHAGRHADCPATRGKRASRPGAGLVGIEETDEPGVSQNSNRRKHRRSSYGPAAALPVGAQSSHGFDVASPASRYRYRTKAATSRGDGRRVLCDRNQPPTAGCGAGNAQCENARLPMQSRFVAAPPRRPAGHVRSLIPGDWNVAKAVTALRAVD